MLKDLHPIIISGPSGAGKDTAIKRLLERNPTFYSAVGYTTRALRKDEIEGVDISTTTVENFKELIKTNQLIEHAEFAGNYYGMPISEVERAYSQVTIFNVGFSAAEVIKKYDPDAITILILPQSKEELKKRIGDRGEERYHRARSDILYASTFFEFVVKSIDGKVDDVVSDIESIICSRNEALKIKYFKEFIDTFFR